MAKKKVQADANCKHCGEGINKWHPQSTIWIHVMSRLMVCTRGYWSVGKNVATPREN